MTDTETIAVARDAFETALDAVRLADTTVTGADGREWLILPDGHEATDITDEFRLAKPVIAERVFDDRQSLADYVNRFESTATVFLADIDNAMIAARVDYHVNAETPGHCRHTAWLKLRPSEEFKRWDGFEGKLHDQVEFATFLEENAVDVKVPDGADLLEVARDLEAVQGVNFKSSIRLENGDRQFTYETETKVKEGVVVPTEFILSIPLYQGEDVMDLTAALRWKVTAGGLLLGFVWRRVEYQRLAHFREIATRLVEDTGAPVFYGR